MKITKLDDFGEGFTVAPRKPHSASTTDSLPLTLAERSMMVTNVVRSRLKKYGVCNASIFTGKARRNALNQMRRIQVSGEIPLDRVTNKSGEVIAYKVIEQ